MIHLGVINRLTVVREVDFGFYLSDLLSQDVLLPRKWAPLNLAIDHEINVFVYLDHEERPIATTLMPKILLNQFAYLKVKMVNNIGAFMDWGMEKDLLVPFKNQPKPLEEDKYYLIYLYLDEETDRLVGTARNHFYLKDDIAPYKVGEAVEALIGEDNMVGKQVIVNHQYRGIIYHSETFSKLKRGAKVTAYVKKVREDGKIDLQIEPIGSEKFEKNAQKVLDYIEKNRGIIYLTDKSSPEDIYQILEMSKKNFKNALGVLYKAQKVILEEKCTKLNG